MTQIFTCFPKNLKNTYIFYIYYIWSVEFIFIYNKKKLTELLMRGQKAINSISFIHMYKKYKKREVRRYNF